MSAPENFDEVIYRRNRRLFAAAIIGSINEITAALQNKADIHASNDLALLLATEKGHTEAVRFLLGRGADIHAQKDAVLRMATRKGHTEIVALLLNHDADIHAENDGALREAAENGHTEIVRLLLEHGADIHACNDYALRWASQIGHAQTALLLLDHGADVHADNDEAIRNAARNKQKAVAALLLGHGADPYQQDSEHKDAFADTPLAEWLSQMRQDVATHFSAIPTRAQCIDETDGKPRLHQRVFEAAAIGQFIPRIAIPLLDSTDQEARQLFQDIWDILPLQWQEQHQNLYMHFSREGGITSGHSAAITEQRTSGRRGNAL